MVLKVKLVLLVLKEKLGHKVFKVSKVQQEHKEHKVLKEQLEHKVFKVSKVF